jgi:hypothetical protein
LAAKVVGSAAAAHGQDRIIITKTKAAPVKSQTPPPDIQTQEQEQNELANAGVDIEATPSIPVHDAPVHDIPVHDAPVHDIPVHDASVHDAPVHDASVHDVPIHDASIPDVPVHDASVYDAPVHDVERNEDIRYFVDHYAALRADINAGKVYPPGHVYTPPKPKSTLKSAQKFVSSIRDFFSPISLPVAVPPVQEVDVCLPTPACSQDQDLLVAALIEPSLALTSQDHKDFVAVPIGERNDGFDDLDCDITEIEAAFQETEKMDMDISTDGQSKESEVKRGKRRMIEDEEEEEGIVGQAIEAKSAGAIEAEPGPSPSSSSSWSSKRRKRRIIVEEEEEEEEEEKEKEVVNTPATIVRCKCTYCSCVQRPPIGYLSPPIKRMRIKSTYVDRSGYVCKHLEESDRLPIGTRLCVWNDAAEFNCRRCLGLSRNALCLSRSINIVGPLPFKDCCPLIRVARRNRHLRNHLPSCIEKRCNICAGLRAKGVKGPPKNPECLTLIQERKRIEYYLRCMTTTEEMHSRVFPDLCAFMDRKAAEITKSYPNAVEYDATDVPGADFVDIEYEDDNKKAIE